MGVEVVDERPYDLIGLDRPSHIYEFGLRYSGKLPDEARRLFQDAVRAVWDGYSEIDGFNTLVLRARITWRQATLLRAYAKYMRQGGSPFALDYIEEALHSNVDLTRMLVDLFETRFDPDRAGEDREAASEEQKRRIEAALDDVASLDHDRILRSYLTHVQATLRTNYFQHGEGGAPSRTCRSSSSPRRSPTCRSRGPASRSSCTRRGSRACTCGSAPVARGGLRWSDRRDDFRTEVLGLVKAQMVKNTVIVPVGAKGGFFAKKLPDPSDRDAWLAEGIASYTTFISGLLDVTDNLVDGETVPPPRVVRHDGDDSYLVVAADKGTATFSDIANGVAEGLRLLARRRLRQRRLGRLRPQGDGHHRPRRVGLGAAPLPRDGASTARTRTSPASASATCPATSSATGCCAPSTSGWWPPSTTATSSSTPSPTPRRRSPSASGSSRCPARRGRTTTPR